MRKPAWQPRPRTINPQDENAQRPAWQPRLGNNDRRNACYGCGREGHYLKNYPWPICARLSLMKESNVERPWTSLGLRRQFYQIYKGQGVRIPLEVEGICKDPIEESRMIAARHQHRTEFSNDKNNKEYNCKTRRPENQYGRVGVCDRHRNESVELKVTTNVSKQTNQFRPTELCVRQEKQTREHGTQTVTMRSYGTQTDDDVLIMQNDNTNEIAGNQLKNTVPETIEEQVINIDDTTTDDSHEVYKSSRKHCKNVLYRYNVLR
ncbi:hypothetical protein CBL_03851, partial [Carabus blaptoides fortunei]